ncbi:MAG: 16S rRNA (uracil(1498)-N(3))-methyltransferase [Gemmataceae bacterium]|nr:16S rRNA (uracil(1498)-N(3))-methyltransferase [Gemmataceae bacterium]
MSERFYVSLPLAPGSMHFDGPEAHHLATVCRLRAGDAVYLFNGDGHEYPARVLYADRREVTLEIIAIESPQRERQTPIHVGVALPKGDRVQFLVEKLTELGVASFTPIECKHSANYPRDGKREKLERYVIEASKQCRRNVLMSITDPMPVAAYAESRQPTEIGLIAHPYDAQPQPLTTTANAIRLIVGPEGGLTNAEVTHAIAHGWQAVNLGPRILRTETAAITLVARVGA